MPHRRLFGETELRRIGRHLRAVREAAGQTQARLAEAAGISERAVRELETGRANPSLGTISGVVDALGITLDHLVAEARRARPAPDFTPASTVGGGRTALTRDLHQPRMRAHILDLSPDVPTEVPDGFVFGHVLRGALTVALGEEQTTLRPGDSLHARPNAIAGWRGRSADTLMIVVEAVGQATGADTPPRARSERDQA